ncbi:MAG: VOC family protein [Luteibacter sp.]
MKLQPYLNFNGNCEDAFRFYAKALGGEILMTSRYKDMPADGAADPASADAMRAAGEKIMHTRIKIGDQLLMGSDCPPNYPYEGIHGVSVALGFDDVDEGRKAFEALSEGARVDMPFGPTFWARGFGMLVDRFGVPWMVNAGENAPE